MRFGCEKEAEQLRSVYEIYAGEEKSILSSGCIRQLSCHSIPSPPQGKKEEMVLLAALQGKKKKRKRRKEEKAHFASSLAMRPACNKHFHFSVSY